MNTSLEMRGVTKWYGDLLANDSIDLSLAKGEILAVVGENGAGKTTLMKILYGLERPGSGEIFLDGKKLSARNPREVMRHGIGMVQQHFMLFPDFSVAENIVFGHEPRKSRIFFDKAGARAAVASLCARYSLDIDPDRLVRDCPVGLQQRVEILKILHQNADIIILDEPSAVLTPQEVDELMKTIRKLAGLGKSFIIITHKLQEVIDVADRVMVMRQGRHMKTMPVADTTIEELSYLMVGRHIAEMDHMAFASSEVVLEVKDLRMRDARGKLVLDGASLRVKRGEIVGIAGVSGNGQNELVHCISGLARPDTGEVLLHGARIDGREIRAIREAGCAHIPEDRYAHGCAGAATLTETAIMGCQRKAGISRHGVLWRGRIREFTAAMLGKYDVKTSGLSQKASELSGGNLQKLIVAREIEMDTPFLVAAEPTRGVDVGAMEFIHGKLLEKRAAGGSVLLVSSELSEIITLSDRIYTMYNGRLNSEFARGEATEEQLGLYMMGGAGHDVSI